MKQLSHALLIFLASSTLAHDMWLEPGRFSGTAGEAIPMRLVIGEEFKAEEERPLGLNRVTRLELFDQGGTGDLLKGQASMTFPAGSGVIVMERTAARIEMKPEKFERYLEEEGHIGVMQDRRRNGSFEQAAREQYSRHLKTVVIGSDEADDDYRHVFGMKLEIVPQSDPRKAKPGDPFEVLVLFEGKALPNARIGVYTKSDAGKVMRTDQDGRATFTIDHPGVVLVRTTVLRSCPNCELADYESFWATLTFEVK